MQKNRASFQQVTKYLEVYIVVIAIMLAILSLLYRDVLLAEGSFKCVLVIGCLKVFRTTMSSSYLDTAKTLIALTILTFLFYTVSHIEELWVSLSISTLYSFIIALMILDPRSLLLGGEAVFIVPFLTLIIHEKDLAHLITTLTSYTLSIAIVNKYSKLKQRVSVLISRYLSISLKLAKYGEAVYRNAIYRYNIRESVDSFTRRAFSFSKSIESKLYRTFWRCSDVGKEVDRLVVFIALFFEKMLNIAMKIETRIGIQMNKLSSILAKFEYFIEHSLLVMLIMVAFLLFITIIFYSIYLP